MGLQHYTTHVNASPDEVWSYLNRPGAMRRLMPAWQPLKPLQETDSLRAGDAVLGLPGPWRWVSAHQPQAYQRGRQFQDVVVARDWRSRPAALLDWTHTHQVVPDGDGTLMLDHLDTPVPARALRRMFAWRGRQLNDDLAALRRLRTLGQLPARVAVTGSSGMVGSALTALLGVAGVEVVRLVRGESDGVRTRTWRPHDPDPRLLDDIDAVVHLAGASIAGRFTPAHRAAIRDSRVTPTHKLAQVAAGAARGPTVFVQSSAIGYYGAQRPGETLDESSSAGHDFLARVCQDWEAASEPAAAAGVRTVQVRTGIVLSAAGGMLRLLRPLYSLGLGGRLGNGRQQMSWIDLDDLVDLFLRSLLDPALQGPLNATAPAPVDGAEFARTLGRVLGRPAVLPVPALGPRLLLGSAGARELALADQRVLPGLALARAHEFRRPELAPSLAHQLGRGPGGGGE